MIITLCLTAKGIHSVGGHWQTASYLLSPFHLQRKWGQSREFVIETLRDLQKESFYGDFWIMALYKPEFTSGCWDYSQTRFWDIEYPVLKDSYVINRDEDYFIFKEQRYNFWRGGGKEKCDWRALAAITCLSGQREPRFVETALPLKLKGISTGPSGGPSCACRVLTATI